MSEALRKIAAIVLAHARERHPHFESPRGVAELAELERCLNEPVIARLTEYEIEACIEADEKLEREAR